jgi:DNA-binding SARP family transcriptional activator/predicted ATPase
VAQLTLNFLGSFQVTLADRPISAFRSAKVQALLIYLALTEQPHARDALAALLWPDEPDVVAKKNLRQSLYQLRQVLEEDAFPEIPFLLASRSTVQFNPASDYALDVSAFRACLENDQLEEAAALYQGDLLPGFTCDSLLFEEWLREERERLHRLALAAQLELTNQYLARADYLAAQELAQRQLALEPWREEAHRQLMQALALLGERSAALAQYETCRAVLAEELGLEPAEETKALVARIRGQQLEASEHRASGRLPERRRLTIPFAGRNSEHSALAKAFQRTGSSGVQMAILLGEAGIGKTRLAQNFLDWAATQGADILHGQAFETKVRLSYQPLTQALRQRLERENAPEDLLSDLWLTELARILPELRDRYPDLPTPTQEETPARQHLFEAITRLGQALAKRAPLVIFFDDWHWADAASLDVLHYAALRWQEERAPIMVLLTLRQEALAESPDLRAWLARLRHDVGSWQFSLQTLSEAETEQLIRELLEEENGVDSTLPAGAESLQQLAGFSRWLFKETDGQPFFLVETLKALADENLVRPDPNSTAWQVDWQTFDEQTMRTEGRVLPGVREIIRGWLERITEPAAQLLTAAAVLDQEASFDHLCRVAEIAEVQALAALDELLNRNLLLERDEIAPAPGRDRAYTFSHQKLRDVVYSEAGAARRRILHRRAFEVLQQSEVPAAELAHHALNGGLWAETIQYSIAAGNEARQLLAMGVAIAHYETAWQLAETMSWPASVSVADRQALYVGLGRAYELEEEWPKAQATYQAMIADAQSMGTPAMECLGLNCLATVYINGFKEPGQAVTFLEQARYLAEENDDRRGLAETEWSLSTAARMERNIDQALYHGQRALAIARELGHPQLSARCLNSLAYVQAYLRRWPEVESYASEAGELYAAADNRILEADSLRLHGWSLRFTGRPGDSLTILKETLAFSQEIGNLWGEVESSWRMAQTLLDLGRYGEAIRLARHAAEQVGKVGVPIMVALSLSTWGAVQRTVMALEPAKVTLSRVLTESVPAGYVDFPLGEMCALQAMTGDWSRANDYARQTLGSRKDETLLPMSLTGWYEAEALLRGGDGDLAQAEVERLSKLVGDNKRYQIPLFRSQAVLAQWNGDAEQAIAHLQTALTLAQEIGLPGEEWSVLAALSELHAAQGQQGQARKASTAAAGIIVRLADTIDDEELRAGFLAAEAIGRVLKASA